MKRQVSMMFTFLALMLSVGVMAQDKKPASPPASALLTWMDVPRRLEGL